jgi:hypothetical protein
MEKRSREFWVELVQKLAASGQTQMAFAAQHGVSDKTLSYWRRRLKKEPAQPPSFVPVCLADTPLSPPQPPKKPSRPAGLKAVLPDGLRLYFAPKTSGAYIARVLGPLRARSC